MNQEERWKCIPKFPSYIISNKGNIMSLPKVSAIQDTHVDFVKQKTGKVLKPRATNGNKHLQVCLTENGKAHWMYVHRLVAIAFLKKRKSCDVVMHIDDNPKNNNVENLQWGTMKENIRWIYKKSPFTQIDDKPKYVYDTINYIRSQSSMNIRKAYALLGERHDRSAALMMTYYYQGKNNIEKDLVVSN